MSDAEAYAAQSLAETRDVEAYAAQLLAETREEVARADGKAEILLAAFGIVIGAVLVGLLSGDWRPDQLDRGATVLFWIGAGLGAVACLALGYSLWPRTRHENAAGPISYYGHVRAYAKHDRYAIRKGLLLGAEYGERTVEQLVVVSDIAWKKFLGIQVAMSLFLIGAVTCAGAATFG